MRSHGVLTRKVGPKALREERPADDESHCGVEDPNALEGRQIGIDVLGGTLLGCPEEEQSAFRNLPDVRPTDVPRDRLEAANAPS